MGSSSIALALTCVMVLALTLACQAQNSPQDYLSPHNAARARVGVGPMAWDNTVAAYAQNYANRRIGDCQLVHSGGHYGENLFWGSGPNFTAADAVNAWVGEKADYNSTSLTCASGRVCGHYTQVVWRNSVRLGCARVRCNSGAIFIICSYDPPGNIVGRSYRDARAPQASSLVAPLAAPAFPPEDGGYFNYPGGGWSGDSDYSTPTPLVLPIAVAINSIVGTVAIILVLICLLKYLMKYLMKKKEENFRIVDNFFRTYEPPGPIRYNYRDVKKMFNSLVDELGKGGFGTVYKGKLPDGRRVAVKVLSESKGNGEEFINEVASIGRTEHVNIVSLLGYCYEGRKRALIYEFMPNGSLDKIIYNKEPRASHALGWAKLYEIAVGTARGLEYLHGGCNTRILHFDIKPHNILLDEDFSPKISDFGLAKQCPTRQSIISMLDARGTAGYIAPEVYCRNVGGVSSKSDVYSYGMMVLEMVGGRKNIDALVENTSEIYFPHWIHRRLDLDGNLGLGENLTKEEEETVRKMIIVGLWCIQLYPANRPSMSKVLEMLEGSLEGLQMPPKPILSSPSRSNESTVVVDIAEGSREGSHISA